MDGPPSPAYSLWDLSRSGKLTGSGLATYRERLRNRFKGANVNEATARGAARSQVPHPESPAGQMYQSLPGSEPGSARKLAKRKIAKRQRIHDLSERVRLLPSERISAMVTPGAAVLAGTGGEEGSGAGAGTIVERLTQARNKVHGFTDTDSAVPDAAGNPEPFGDLTKLSLAQRLAIARQRAAGVNVDPPVLAKPSETFVDVFPGATPLAVDTRVDRADGDAVDVGFAPAQPKPVTPKPITPKVGQGPDGSRRADTRPLPLSDRLLIARQQALGEISGAEVNCGAGGPSSQTPVHLRRQEEHVANASGTLDGGLSAFANAPSPIERLSPPHHMNSSQVVDGSFADVCLSGATERPQVAASNASPPGLSRTSGSSHVMASTSAGVRRVAAREESQASIISGLKIEIAQSQGTAAQVHLLESHIGEKESMISALKTEIADVKGGLREVEGAWAASKRAASKAVRASKRRVTTRSGGAQTEASELDYEVLRLGAEHSARRVQSLEQALRGKERKLADLEYETGHCQAKLQEEMSRGRSLRGENTTLLSAIAEVRLRKAILQQTVSQHQRASHDAQALEGEAQQRIQRELIRVKAELKQSTLLAAKARAKLGPLRSNAADSREQLHAVRAELELNDQANQCERQLMEDGHKDIVEQLQCRVAALELQLRWHAKYSVSTRTSPCKRGVEASPHRDFKSAAPPSPILEAPEAQLAHVGGCVVGDIGTEQTIHAAPPAKPETESIACRADLVVDTSAMPAAQQHVTEKEEKRHTQKEHVDAAEAKAKKARRRRRKAAHAEKERRRATEKQAKIRGEAHQPHLTGPATEGGLGDGATEVGPETCGGAWEAEVYTEVLRKSLGSVLESEGQRRRQLALKVALPWDRHASSTSAEACREYGRVLAADTLARASARAGETFGRRTKWKGVSVTSLDRVLRGSVSEGRTTPGTSVRRVGAAHGSARVPVGGIGRSKPVHIISAFMHARS